MKPQEFDPIFEAMLRQAVRDNIYEEAESVPNDNVLSEMFTISEKHDARMRRLCAREDRRELVHSITRPLKKTAVFLLIVVTILSSALMLNTNVRAAVVEVVVEWYEQFTRFVGIASDEPTEKTSWEPSYLPEGYVEVSRIEDVLSSIIFEDDTSTSLKFTYSIADRSLDVDNEEAEYTPSKIDGITYYIFDAKDDRKSNRVVWICEGYSFYLSGYLTIDELLETAKSVK